MSAVDSSSPQRTNNVSPGNPWDLSVLDPMVASQPQVCYEIEKCIYYVLFFVSIVWLIGCYLFRRGGTSFKIHIPVLKVADPHHFNADLDSDFNFNAASPTFHFNVDPY